MHKRVKPLLAAAGALLAGCVSFSELHPGQSMAEVEKIARAPTDKHTDARGNPVWEYNLQPEGRQTWMVTFGADGKVAQVQQVLTEENIGNIREGQSTRDDVLQLLGKPSLRVTYANLREEVWDYGYFQDTWRMLLSVHFDADSGRVKYYTTIPDPAYYVSPQSSSW